MVRSAPRYDPRVLDALEALDDRGEPMAEICRRVAREAEALGLTRPSYVHLRPLLLAVRERQDEDRARREAIRAIVADVAVDLLVGRLVDAYEVADRIQRVPEGHRRRT